MNTAATRYSWSDPHVQHIRPATTCQGPVARPNPYNARVTQSQRPVAELRTLLAAWVDGVAPTDSLHSALDDPASLPRQELGANAPPKDDRARGCGEYGSDRRHRHGCHDTRPVPRIGVRKPEVSARHDDSG